MVNFRREVALLLALGAAVPVVTFAPRAVAQLSTTATIAGTVTDATGAVVSDADITITSQDTGVVTHAKSEADGSYVAPGLAVGAYSVTVAKTGFDSFTAKGIALHPAVTSTVAATLKVGGSSTEVTVSAVASEVETTTADLSNSVQSQQVGTLPMNGRNYQGLATLMPGVQNTSAGSALTTGGRSTNNAISVNGLQQNKVFYALDGVWNENTGNMNQTSVVPNPDSLEEVRVLQNNYSARYSLMGSSVVLLQTRSGTNKFHGTAWEFLRNEDLNAKPYFSSSILPYKQNIFGYNIGGPVFIPKVYNRDRNKTFFFWSEQWVILHQTPTGTLTAITPTANQRAGLFSSPVKNPVTGLNYAQNAQGLYAVTNINPSAQALLNAVYPLPNYSAAGSANNYINRVPQITDQRDDEIKIDHNFSPKFHLLGEYLDEYQKYQQNSLAGAQSGEIYETNGETDFTHNKLAQLALTQVWTQNLLNNTNIAMNIFDLDLNLTGLGTIGQVQGYSESLPYNGYIANRIPLVTFSGGLGAEGIPAARPLTHAADLDDTVGDDLSWLHGRHFLQAGASLIFNTKRQNVSSATNGQFAFDGHFTRPTTGTANTLDDSIADFLTGNATTFTQTSDQPRVPIHGHEVSFYGEDRMKVTRNLTVTAGLRMFWAPLPDGPPHTLTNFVPSSYSLTNAPLVSSSGTTTQTAASLMNPLNGLLYNGPNSTLPQNFSNAHNWYAGPIAGFAWDVFGNSRTSVRGGYGFTYTKIFTNQDCSFACATNPPAISTVNLQNVAFPAVVGSGTSKPATATPLSAADQDIRPTQIQSYSLGIQHEFPHSWIASATAASSQARHLLGTYNANQPLPTSDGHDFDPRISCGNFYVTGYSASNCTGAFYAYYYQTAATATAAAPAAQFSPYPGYAFISQYNSRQQQNWNALELSLKHPVTTNVYLTVAYTYSHDLTNYTSASMPLGTANVVDPYHQGRYYGNAEGLDYRHSIGITAIYQFPIFAHSSGLAHNLLGGWKLSDITTLRSGTAVTPTVTFTGQGATARPNRVSGTSVGGPHTKAQWFNTAAFTAPTDLPNLRGYYGNAQIGSIRGPGLITFDGALYKEFHISAPVYFEFRAEAFNLLNHTNFTTVNAQDGSASYGQITAAADPRVLEFSGRFHF